MDYVVAKDFKSVNRRFTVGMPITPEEVIGPVSFDLWMERGFIKEGLAASEILPSGMSAATPPDETHDENTVRAPRRSR